MQKKYIFSIISIAFLILLWIILWPQFSQNIGDDNQGCSISDGTKLCGDSDINSGKNATNIVNGELTSMTQLYGKPTFLRRAGKFCAYCREKLPQVEELILRQYKDQINIQLMTMDFDKKPFDTVIPQSPFDTFNFEDFTWKPCDTFPTWVILDKQWELSAQECWGKMTIEEVADEINHLL